MTGATFIGNPPILRGQHAIIQQHPDDAGKVLAQFDEPVSLGGVNLSLRWHEFPADAFRLDPPEGT